MDWTQFFNPSSWGSFAPSMMSPAADPMAVASGKPGVAAPVSTPQQGQNSQGMGQAFTQLARQLGPQQIQPVPMQPIQYYRPGQGRPGMLG